MSCARTPQQVTRRNWNQTTNLGVCRQLLMAVISLSSGAGTWVSRALLHLLVGSGGQYHQHSVCFTCLLTETSTSKGLIGLVRYYNHITYKYNTSITQVLASQYLCCFLSFVTINHHIPLLFNKV